MDLLWFSAISTFPVCDTLNNTAESLTNTRYSYVIAKKFARCKDLWVATMKLWLEISKLWIRMQRRVTSKQLVFVLTYLRLVLTTGLLPHPLYHYPIILTYIHKLQTHPTQ